MALTGQELENKLLKYATRLFAFSENCPKSSNPYRFKALLLISALDDAAPQILATSKSHFIQEFVPSISQQYRDKGYLSNRQLEIVENVLRDNNYDVDAILEAAKRETDDALTELQKAFPDEIKEYLPLAAKQYKDYCAQYAASFRRRW